MQNTAHGEQGVQVDQVICLSGQVMRTRRHALPTAVPDNNLSNRLYRITKDGRNMRIERHQPKRRDASKKKRTNVSQIEQYMVN